MQEEIFYLWLWTIGITDFFERRSRPVSFVCEDNALPWDAINDQCGRFSFRRVTYRKEIFSKHRYARRSDFNGRYLVVLVCYLQSAVLLIRGAVYGVRQFD